MHIQFLGRMIAVVGVFALVVAACGGGEEEAAPQPTTPPVATSPPAATAAPVAQPTATPRPTAAPAPTPTAVPVPRGELIVVPPTLGNFALFPLPANGAGDPSYLDTMYGHMIGATQKGVLDFSSGFATSATANGASTQWTMKLRNNVVFQNGDTATAKDVAYTVSLATSPESQLTRAPELRRLLTKLETPDDQTVVFTLNEGNIFFPSIYLASISGSGMPYWLWPQKYIESIGGWREANKKPIGSGPYKFKSLIVGDRIVVEAVDKHWYFGVPRTKTVTFILIPDEGTRIALLKTGAADLAPVSEKSAASLKGLGFRTIASIPQSGVMSPLRIDDPLPNGVSNPLSNEDVRKALGWYAIDRPALAAAFFPLSGSLSMEYPVNNPADPAYDVNNRTPVPPYDPNRARALLAQAGYPRGFELDAYSFRPQYEEAFEAIIVYWEQIGIKVKRIPTPIAQLISINIAAIKDPFKKATVSGLNNQAYYPIAASTVPIVAHDPLNSFFTTAEPEITRRAKAFTKATTLDEYIKAGRDYQKYGAEHLLNWWPMLDFAVVYAASSKMPKDWEPGASGRLDIAIAAASR